MADNRLASSRLATSTGMGRLTGFLPFLAQCLGLLLTERAHGVEQDTGDGDGGGDTTERLGAGTRRQDGFPRSMGTERDKVRGLLLVQGQLFPVLLLQLLQRLEGLLLLCWGEGLPRCLDLEKSVSNVCLRMVIIGAVHVWGCPDGGRAS